MAQVHCRRCQRDAAGVDEVPYSDPLATELLANVCRECWQDWLTAEVMVINELRLDFMRPESQDILIQHLREFFALDRSAAPPNP